jgi:hypothetical protein
LDRLESFLNQSTISSSVAQELDIWQTSHSLILPSSEKL